MVDDSIVARGMIIRGLSAHPMIEVAGFAINTLASLRGARAALEDGLTPDAVLSDVERAMNALGEVTGQTLREDLTARIFERFCVGK